MAILGAEVTVFDISEDNKKYALEVAASATLTNYNSRYVNKGEGAYFWSSDEVFVSDSLSNGIVRNISCYHSGIRRMTSRLIMSESTIRPSYSVRLVKVEK